MIDPKIFSIFKKSVLYELMYFECSVNCFDRYSRVYEVSCLHSVNYKIKQGLIYKKKIKNQFKLDYNNKLFLVIFLQLSLAKYIEPTEVAVYNCFPGCSKCFIIFLGKILA